MLCGTAFLRNSSVVYSRSLSICVIWCKYSVYSPLKLGIRFLKMFSPDLLFSRVHTLRTVFNIQPGERSCLDCWLHKNFSFSVLNFVALIYGFLLTTFRFVILLTPFWAQYFRDSNFHIRV